MVPQKDSNQLISNSLFLLSQLMDSDTEAVIVDLNLLENLNTNQSLNYIKLDQYFTNIEQSTQDLERENEDFEATLEKLDAIERRVCKMESIISELDCWSRDLEKQIQQI